MFPRRPRTTSPTTRMPLIKEIRDMASRLNRFLDFAVSITIVSLALYIGVATAGLGAIS